MAITENCAAIEASMTKAILAAGQTVPTFGVGLAELLRHGAPPRIVFVPQKGPVRKAPAPGGTPPAIWERREGIDAHIWGDDVAACETLLGHLAAAVQEVMTISGEITSTDWTAAKQIDTAGGELLVVGLVFRIPITREPAPTAEFTVTPITPQVDHTP
jgi:hypothetical protein